MAKIDEITIEIKVEPTLETVLHCKRILEMWLNASPTRGARVETNYDDDGNSTQYLYVFDVDTGQEWGADESQTETS